MGNSAAKKRATHADASTTTDDFFGRDTDDAGASRFFESRPARDHVSAHGGSRDFSHSPFSDDTHESLSTTPELSEAGNTRPSAAQPAATRALLAAAESQRRSSSRTSTSTTSTMPLGGSWNARSVGSSTSSLAGTAPTYKPAAGSALSAGFLSPVDSERDVSRKSLAQVAALLDLWTNCPADLARLIVDFSTPKFGFFNPNNGLLTLQNGHRIVVAPVVSREFVNARHAIATPRIACSRRDQLPNRMQFEVLVTQHTTGNILFSVGAVTDEELVRLQAEAVWTVSQMFRGFMLLKNGQVHRDGARHAGMVSELRYRPASTHFEIPVRTTFTFEFSDEELAMTFACPHGEPHTTRIKRTDLGGAERLSIVISSYNVHTELHVRELMQ